MRFFRNSLYLALAMSAASPAYSLPTNDELKIGMTQEFENLNPLIGTMVATTYMGYLANRNLAILTPDGKWVAQMAKKIPSTENKLMKIVDVDGKKGIEATWEILDKA
ncbi:MAG: peptide ABC transporter substrate-binding protein, partial [Pseudobdellovibrionaceae bacterium]